jgi:hypothetical protein
MSNIVKQTVVADGFTGYTGDIEGHERPANAGLIQGLTKFTNEAKWVRDDEEIAPDRELIAADVVRVLQRWEDGKPIETRILEPGEKFPDVKALNDAVPREDWSEGPDGHPRGPWQAQHILYLVDPVTMDRFSYPTATTGGGIAIRELVDKITLMRRTRGPNLYAIVTLGDTFMQTKFGGRQRPHFKIARWVRLGNEGGEELAALPAPTAPTLQPVQEPSLAEDFNDELPDLAAPKKAASKSNGKRVKSEAA